MLEREVNLLCTGDLHLGRYPTKLPSEYSSDKFSPISIWLAIVEKAIDLEVDGVLITGDIIDRENRYYEAYGPFEEGLKRLIGEGIAVFAVSGNHDYDLLPRLAKNIDSKLFTLLGEGGRWESKTLFKDGEALLNLVGWSYPTRHVHRDPLRELKVEGGSLPIVGLLHCETDNPSSNYAPVSQNNLEEVGITGWILGHIHNSFLKITPTSFILNPGSPQPLSPKDRGYHSIWQLSIKSKNDFEISPLDIANLKYTELEVDISKISDLKDLPTIISIALEEQIEQEGNLEWRPEFIIVRLNLVGRTDLHSEIIYARDDLLEQLNLSVGASKVIIERLNNNTRPSIDLQSLAQGNNSVALLADYLLKLEEGREDEIPEELLSKIKGKLIEAYYSNAYGPLRSQERISLPDDEVVFSLLKREGQLLLDALLAQKEELR